SVDDLADHPGCRRPADDENEVAAARGPGVPEVLERREKSGAPARKPRQLVEEYHPLPPPPSARLEVITQPCESFGPARRWLLAAPSRSTERIREVGQLIRHLSVVNTRQLEAQALSE